MEAAVAALEAAAEKNAGAAAAAWEAAVAAFDAATGATGVAKAAKEAAAATLATAKQAAAASSTAKKVALAAEAAATKAAGVAKAAKKAAEATLVAAEQATAASSTAVKVAMAADAAAKESAAAAAAAMHSSKKRSFHQIDDEGSRVGNRDDRGNLHLIIASPTRSSAASSTCFGKEPAASVAATAKEPVAAMRYSKKLKFHQIDDGGSGGGNRDNRGNLDLISTLPDKVLGSIISLLPTKDGARTQAISRRWLLLWRSAPLNLEVSFKQGIKNSKLIALVSKILSKHRGHARRLHLFLFDPTDIPACSGESKIDGWLRSQVLDTLQELDFTYRNIAMPLSVFRFAPTLRFARFRKCHFPESVSTLHLKFPCLKQLTMDMVAITEDGLHSMLTGCTALESLELRQICGIGGICISSQTLRSLAFSTHHVNKGVILQLVIKDTPALERLLPLYSYKGQATIRVILAPKLEILGWLSEGISKVQFGSTIFEKMIAVSITTKIHTMKVLVLDSIGTNLGAVLDFLKCFPCLVRLYVMLHPTKDMDNARKYDLLDPIECLEFSLKKVVLMNYDGSKRPSVDFAKFFVLNTKLLKEMEIGILNNRNDEWMANQRKQLHVENRASRDARIELKMDRGTTHLWIADTHDLSMADPFDNKSFRRY
ncbi:hypothetical protein ACQ4PT_019414 [Festuca glaucescens]